MNAEEQTPIQILQNNLSLNEQIIIEQTETLPERLVKSIEEYAKQEVLKALEKEFEEVIIYKHILGGISYHVDKGIEYFEEHVKPKYQ